MLRSEIEVQLGRRLFLSLTRLVVLLRGRTLEWILESRRTERRNTNFHLHPSRLGVLISLVAFFLEIPIVVVVSPFVSGGVVGPLLLLLQEEVFVGLEPRRLSPISGLSMREA